MPSSAPSPVPSPVPRRVVVPVLVGYLAAVAAVTLTPGRTHDGSLGVVRTVLAWLTDRGVPLTFEALEAVANVVMFVPFGVLVGLLLGARRWWAVVLLALATSVTIETVQRALPDRFPTVQDVVLNTLGAAVGVAALAWALPRVLRRPGRTRPGSASADPGRGQSRPAAAEGGPAR
ncbi:VanZ family protein [Cellulomonas shaoxiangyii]|uniref:VanZ family protein n=1 Tax=Cellulomonas shaoxiangyii TaxID=2566013 RepID=A0A4V1CMY2_9CELL|nr:VanZ family protein [Cellulomonas shaoxiangyii]QCB94535.1 VanZ family protein [Cellulomonas shaoxiangyii]TGY82321.1 VanZ family protein [Cellulomonas shaoxiangyii]